MTGRINSKLFLVLLVAIKHHLVQDELLNLISIRISNLSRKLKHAVPEGGGLVKIVIKQAKWKNHYKVYPDSPDRVLHCNGFAGVILMVQGNICEIACIAGVRIFDFSLKNV